ncbi:MAG TPA: sugar phosphate nucleotidyltransferase [Pyrinomonadaceae bacterium]|nr:sugar phosphate nucleotidyltransferase [Pyrinomonadaceae bacterium]
MKTVILCGGRGTRMGEHGAATPKALIEVGGRPVLWHLMKLYAHYGLSDFILCLGHLGGEIRNYFEKSEPVAIATKGRWSLTFADTGLDTNTGGRIKHVGKHLWDEEDFCVTYGDGLADLDLQALIEFHKEHGRIGTITAVRPHLNFGIMKLSPEGAVTEFHEKPLCADWINGGFFVFRRGFLDYLEETSVLEHEPLETLSRERQLIAWRHPGFWKCMDTYKDNVELNQLWESGEAAWKVWER